MNGIQGTRSFWLTGHGFTRIPLIADPAMGASVRDRLTLPTYSWHSTSE